MSTDNAAGTMRIFGEAREDLLNVPTGEPSIDLIACADPDWRVDGNTVFMDRLAQIFAALNIESQMRTVILGCTMQRELPNGGILGSSNIIYSPERLLPKLTGLRLIYVDGVRGIERVLHRLRVPHAWVIGGAKTFRQLAPYCRRAYIVPDERHTGSGETMPHLENLIEWRLEKTFDGLCGSGRCLSLSKYVNCRCLGLDGTVPKIYGKQ